MFSDMQTQRIYYLWILTKRINKGCLSTISKIKPVGIYEIFNGVLKNNLKFN